MADQAKNHLDRLHGEFMLLAAAGQHLPTISALAEKMGIAKSYFYLLLDRGHRQGVWALARDGERITAIIDPKGKWLVQCYMRRWRPEASIPSRKCLRCREAFAPAHRTNFMCQDCREYAAQAAP